MHNIFSPSDNATLATEIYQDVMSNIPYLGYYHHLFTICVPSTCSDGDVANMVNMNGIDFTTREVYCDTRQSISLREQLTNLKPIQKVALAFVTSVLALVFISTFLEAVDRQVECLQPFSVVSNAKKLFLVDDVNRISYIDYAKLAFMICVLIVHSFVSLESPIGGYMCRYCALFAS